MRSIFIAVEENPGFSIVKFLNSRYSKALGVLQENNKSVHTVLINKRGRTLQRMEIF